MTYFYARVSTREQNLDRQLVAAEEYKTIDEVFADKQSGKTFDRPQYNKLKSKVVSGDEVIIKELDRLGRNKEGVKEEIRWFREKGVILRILDIPTTLIDFQGQDWVSEMVTNILIEVLGSISQQEREKTMKRQREGIDAMKIIDGKKVSAKTGRFYGRQALDIDTEIIKKQKEGLISVTEACSILGISRGTWYNKVGAL